MYEIPLQAIPNQKFSVRLEGVLFELTIKMATSVMAATIIRDGRAVVRGVRCLPGIALIPHYYMEGAAGNFYFLTKGGKYPDYARFGAQDRLMYMTLSELKETRNARDT